MTDKEHKSPDAEVLNMEELAAASLSSNQNRPEKSGGAGLVWFLAFALLAGGGTYAAWPYIGSTVTPMLEEAQAMLGLQARPTQPTLPQGALGPEKPVNKLATVPSVEPTPAPADLTQYPPTDFSPKDPMPQGAGMAADAAPAPAPTAKSGADVVDADTAKATAIPAMAQKDETVLPVMSVSTQFERRLNERMDALEDRLKAAAAANDDAKIESSDKLGEVIKDLRAEVQALNARLKRLESAPRGASDPSASAQALVLSVAQLATQAESAEPFATALGALERVGGKDPVVATALDNLRAYGEKGIPTQATLTEDFNGVAGAVMKVHSQSQRSGWWGEVECALGNLVSVRQTDPTRIDDAVERALAVAAQALDKKDLKTSLAALAEIQGAEADALRPWLSAAQARVNIQDALQALHNHALAALAATGGA